MLETARLGALYLGNGLLVVSFVLFENGLALLLLPPLIWLGSTCPREQRPVIIGASALTWLAALVATPPIPVIVLVMAYAGAVAVWRDKFNPRALRWRVSGGLALEALAALGYVLSAAYLAHLDANAWGATFAQDEAGAVLAQGRAFLSTIAVWGTWLIIPLGYFSLLIQGLFVHPPAPASPEQLITRVRSRGQS